MLNAFRGILASALLSLLAACTGGGGEQAAPKPDDKVAPEVEPEAQLVAASVAWELRLPGTGVTDDVIDANCLSCHGGAVAPNLKHKPLTSEVMTRVMARMNDEARPMPPSGLLAIEKRKTVDATGYKLRVRWAAAGQPLSEAVDVTLSGDGKGLSEHKGVPRGVKLRLLIEVLGPRGELVATKDVESAEVDDAGRVWMVVEAAALAPGHGATPVSPLPLPGPGSTPSPSSPSPGTPQGPAPTPAIEATTVAVKLDLALRLVMPDAIDPDAVTYADIRDVIDARCISCHKPGVTAPDLTKFPFPDGALAKVAKRIHDDEAPMPPSGLMPTAALARLDAWIDGGARAAPSAPQAADPSTYRVRFRWAPATEILSPAIDAALDAEGRASKALATLPLGSTVRVTAEVLGPTGIVLAERTFDQLEVPASGLLALTLVAPAEDAKAPVPGQQGQIAVQTAPLAGKATITWKAATDDQTPTAALAYRVFLNGQPLTAFVSNLLKHELTGLAQNVGYEATVVVRDAAGHEASYETAAFVLHHDAAPTPGQGGAVAAGAVTDRSLEIAWAAASDDLTAEDKLEYLVVAATDDNPLTTLAQADKAIPVGSYARAPLKRALKGIVPSTKYRFNVIVRDQAGHRALYGAIEVTSAGDAGDSYDILAYGKDCAERLGELKPFNCLDGEVIPITVGGQVPAEGYPAFGPNGDHDQDCDKPALLGLGGDGRCPPYARLGRLKSYRADGSVHPDVETVFICRRYKGRYGNFPWQGQTYSADQFPGFEDVAIIQHDRKTGETCWFQMLAQANSKDARRVPPPTEAVLPANAPSYALTAKQFWLSPQSTAGIDCIKCHDSDPWIHSPYVDQVKLPNGETVVPSNPFGQYKMIGRRFFTEWRSEAIATTTPPPGGPDETCTSCHRIGSRNTCDQFGPQSVGLQTAANSSTHAINSFALSHWMPPSGITSQAAWSASATKKHWDEIQDCCNDPSAPGCKATPVNAPPPPFAGP